MSDAVAITADNEIHVNVRVGWLPGLSRVNADILFKFRGTDDQDAQNKLIKDMQKYITVIKEKTLTTITTDSVERRLFSDPGCKSPYWPRSNYTGWYSSPSGVGFSANMQVLDRDDVSDVLSFDDLETLLQTKCFDAVRTSKTPTT